MFFDYAKFIRYLLLFDQGCRTRSVPPYRSFHTGFLFFGLMSTAGETPALPVKASTSRPYENHFLAEEVEDPQETMIFKGERRHCAVHSVSDGIPSNLTCRNRFNWERRRLAGSAYHR
jgi:hypothetical protein